MDQKKPHIFLFVLDTARRDHFSCYDYHRATTPNIDKLADSGLVFNNAFANSNWTPTSHGSIFTGQLPSESGVVHGTQKLPGDIQLLPEIIRNQGYRTFAASAGVWITKENGYDRGFDQFIDINTLDFSRSSVSKVFSDLDIFIEYIKYLTFGHDTFTNLKFKKLKRFVNEDDINFGFINSKSPHHPYNPPRPYKSRYCSSLSQPLLEIFRKIKEEIGMDGESVEGFDTDRLNSMSYDYPLMGNEFTPTDEEWEIIKSWYDGSIRYVDEVVGDFIRFLKKMQLYNESIIIVTSDHGEQFGEHDLEKHQLSLYDELLNVPLIISGGAVDGDEYIDAMVSLVDLFPTITGAAGDQTKRSHFSESLIPVQSKYNEHIISEVGAKDTTAIERRHDAFDPSEYEKVRGPLRAVRNGSHKLITSDEEYELIDWRSNQFLDTDQTPESMKQLQNVVDNNLPEFPEYGGEISPKSDEIKSRLENLGYL